MTTSIEPELVRRAAVGDPTAVSALLTDVRPGLVARDHPATTFEIFFDLVFVFALTRIIAFMGQPPSPQSMARGLLLLVLLWFSWSSYAWLGNQTRADVGVVRAGVLAAMAASFVAALVMPQAWSPGPGPGGPLLLALAYVVLRAVHLALYYWAAAATPGLRARIRVFAAASAAGWLPLVLGALLGGTAQSALWALAFAVEVGGSGSPTPSAVAGRCTTRTTSPNGTGWS
ncbi:low temperature requirement protein A [Micromonospora sp. 4G55]|uniref:low temperature requirement protein A n=1 Tax=Micromonospora sp. 4G55 TaxID=2806102 RepID=UPI002103A8CD|nr:low temperature requirement protein A [Micromonospora sp. 4G55]